MQSENVFEVLLYSPDPDWNKRINIDVQQYYLNVYTIIDF